ncbi:MAG: hypothetical protein JKY33_03605 [Bacteroidia bacterium]|nr:hypothetical protein [Bacteroidia bacterium]
MKKLNVNLVVYLIMANILLLDINVIASTGTENVPMEIDVNEKVYEGTVIRYFRKLTPESSALELQDLPRFVNIEDNITGKIYESYPINNYIKEGEPVKFYKKQDRVVVIEKPEMTWDIFEGTIVKSFKKYAHGSSELSDLHNIISIKDKESGEIYESSPLLLDYKVGDEVQFFLSNGKALVLIGN